MSRAACGGACLLVLAGAAAELCAQPADTGWPMFRHDLQGTNRADVAGPAAGQIKWSVPSPTGTYFGLQAVGPDGVIYGSAGTGMHALDPADGSTLWSVSQPGYLPGTLIVEQDGSLLTFWREDTTSTAKAGLICQLDAGGNVLHTADLQRALNRPIVGTDGTIYAHRDGPSYPQIAALDIDGSVLWSVGGPAGIDNLQKYGGTCRQVSMGQNGHLYVACGLNDCLISVDVSSGTVRWESTPLYGGLFCMGQSDLIYTGCERGLRCVQPDAGIQLWQYDVVKLMTSTSLLANGDVVAWRDLGSGNAGVYCFEPDGDIAWQFTIPRPAFFNMPIVTDAAGRAYVYNDELLLALDSEGTPVWHLEFLQSSNHDLILGPDGTLYLSHDGIITAIGDAAIPGDANHDGRVNIFDAFLLNAAWGTHEGEPAFNPDADFSGDGAVNIFDAFILNSNWQGTLGPAEAAVPEPATVLLAACGAALIAGRRRRPPAGGRRPAAAAGCMKGG